MRQFSKYWAILKTQIANNMVYPVDMLSRTLSIVLFMWVFTQLWRAVYRSAGAGMDAALAGLSLREVLWYLMLAETITLSKPRLSTTISNSVKDGSIAYLLNKPVNYLLYQGSLALGDGLSHMLFNLLAGGVIVWLSVGPPPDPIGWPFVFLTILLAWMIDFCLASLIGLAAFITEDVSAFEWIYQKFVFILGGLLIPLDFYPEWLRAITQALPFAYTVYGPARFFVDPTPQRFVALLAGQIAWLTALGAVVALTFRRASTRLAINGG